MKPRVDRSPGKPGWPGRPGRPRTSGRRTAGLAAVAVATLALATACGSSSHPSAASTATAIQPGSGQSLAGAPGATTTGPVAGTSMPSMTMPTASGSTGAPAAPVAGNAVLISGFAFAPAALTVKVGTTVTWTNKDGDAHTVTSQGSGGPLASKALNTGQSYSFTFTKAGTYSYLCTIHPFMTATVTVTQ